MGDMELIVSCRQALVTKYGADGFALLEAKLKELQAALQEAGMASALVYVDDGASLKPYGLHPLRKPQAKTIKKLLDNLEIKSAATGGVTHWLIVGGHEIIPFHLLKNPTNDEDKVVYSDNPYASSDDEPLIPEHSLGPLPDDDAKDTGFLLTAIDHAIAGHKSPPATTGAFGESAQVWQKASQAVIKSVGATKSALKISPPETRLTFRPLWLKGKRYDYFNLHGAEDTPYWYGQQDDRYPVAVGPQEIGAGQVKSAVVFSEACFGANIIGKKAAEAICLTYLQQGAACFVGSTVTAYGPAEPPSSEADLLGQIFLEHVKAGSTFGEALCHAKREFARAMFERQGYLDGDDEKTLLEFVLYGDPSLRGR